MLCRKSALEKPPVSWRLGEAVSIHAPRGRPGRSDAANVVIVCVLVCAGIFDVWRRCQRLAADSEGPMPRAPVFTMTEPFHVWRVERGASVVGLCGMTPQHIAALP